MHKKLTNALMGLAVMLTAIPVSALADGDRPGYGHYGWEWGWGHMIFGSLMMVLFWGGIILIIVLAVRWLGHGPSHGAGSSQPDSRALDILRERFARGEIDQEEFENRKRMLSD